jgi:hypothetical protein
VTRRASRSQQQTSVACIISSGHIAGSASENISLPILIAASQPARCMPQHDTCREHLTTLRVFPHALLGAIRA